MSDETAALIHLLQRDQRYPIEAYFFVREALAYAADKMELGACSEPECQCDPSDPTVAESSRHLTGQQLCEAIRQFAIQQYGFMAKVVLNEWGIGTTQDFGEIVYNMIDIGLMKKSRHDRKSHFADVYDFDAAFQDNFVMSNGSVAQRMS